MFVFIIIESPDDTNEEDNDTTNILTLYLCIMNDYYRKVLKQVLLIVKMRVLHVFRNK